MFYVYVLFAPDGSPFYVGKGQKRRTHDHKNEAKRGCQCRKCVIIRDILASGADIRVEIVFKTENEDEAFEQERAYIARYGRANIANQGDGGRGPMGVVRSEETRKKLSEIGKRRFDDPEYRAKASAKLKAVYADPARREAARNDTDRLQKLWAGSRAKQPPKLTEDDVRVIRAMYATGNYLQADLARRFGICNQQVSAIVLRKKWKSVQ